MARKPQAVNHVSTNAARGKEKMQGVFEMNVWRCLKVCAAVAAAGTCWAQRGGVDDRLPESEIPPLTLEDAFNIDRKEPGWFTRAPGEKTPAAQLQRARTFEDASRHERARMAYNSLVRHWHSDPEALEAQIKVAEMWEKLRDHERAFKEYQYLFTHFAGRFDVNDILRRQFQIANMLAARSRKVWGVPVQSYEEDRLRYEQIAINAPNSALAPEALLKVAAHFELDGKFPAAADAYARVRTRFSTTPQALAAAHAEARCRYIQAMKHDKDDALAQNAIATIAVILQQYPRLPERAELEVWRDELREKREEDGYQQALFYDKIRKQPRAALVAYRQFLQQHPASPRVTEVRERVQQLEAQLEPQTP